MNRSQSKYFNTAARMDEALLALLEEKDFEYVTVKELCQRAGVNRSTFYLHYETLGDLLTECIAYSNQRFLDYMQRDSSAFVPKIQTCPLEELYLLTPDYLAPYLRYVCEHRRVFRAAVRNPGALQVSAAYDALVRHVLSPILERFSVPEAERAYRITFYVHGLMAIVTQWLERDCADSIEFLISLFQRCVLPGEKTSPRPL